MANNSLILDVARKTRSDCEKIAFSDLSKDKHYYQREDLEFMCAAASKMLVGRLRKLGIDACFYEAEFHCAVLVDDCIVVDITATQFNKNGKKYNSVLNMPLNSYKKEFFHAGDFCKRKKLPSGWPAEQMLP